MTENTIHSNEAFLFQWFRNTAIGLILAGIAVVILLNILGLIIGFWVSLIAIFLVIITVGFIIGYSQQLLLDDTAEEANRWVFATGLGWTVGFVAGMLTPWIRMGDRPLSHLGMVFPFGTGIVFFDISLTGIVVLSAILGISQWIILRRWVLKAKMWIAARIVIGMFSWSIAVAVIKLTMIPGPPDIGTGLTLFMAPLALGGAVILSEGALGILLVWLSQPLTKKVDNKSL